MTTTLIVSGVCTYLLGCGAAGAVCEWEDLNSEAAPVVTIGWPVVLLPYLGWKLALATRRRMRAPRLPEARAL